MHVSPSTYVILIAGGVRKLARKLEISATSVSKWRTRKDGKVPQAHHGRLLALAKEYNWILTAEHFVHGAELEATPEHHVNFKLK